MLYMCNESRRWVSVRQTRPLHLAEAVRYVRARVARVIDDDRNQKGYALGHVTSAFDRQPPLAAEVALMTSVRVGGDDRYEEGAIVDLLANRAIPGIPAAKLALVEPDFYACDSKRIGNAFRRFGIL